ncbi:unnamed protein product [Sordaria macrospora k-hell]|uniref:WGS project CABT00000000 data, contig 2.5 n=2 Tax=Sordaria macrospora TaxID=5147 RepID=F7VSA3_SORMK|nr:uncharacterized protein SMAC_01934 [Sordaria macrospora k-hell]KAH7631858.1 hypothetical protein B0T09DRAFT_260201 [Sordaria sp. MPI-SDFR-AT-0083]CCC08389.1 unnamed protein product [Sordaria macrospora k-hell]
MGGADNNNEAGGKTGCGKFNIFCRGNRTNGKGRNNNGDGWDKGGGKEKDSGNGDGNSSSRPNKPESTTIISPTPGPTSLSLVSGQTQAPTLSLPADLSLSSMESSSLKVSPSFTTSYVPEATKPNQATWTPEESNQKSSAASVKRNPRQAWWDILRALNEPSSVTERTKTVADSESVGSLCSYEKVNELLPQPHTPGIEIQYQQPSPVHQHCGSPLPYATFANFVYPANIADPRNLAPAAMYSHQAGQFSTSSNRSQDGSLGTTLVSNGAGEIQYVNHLDSKHLISPCSPFQGPGQRMSDMSSLSSGFGDGEFIMRGQILQPPLPAAIAYPSSPTGTTNRFSELSTQQGGGKRDTMYTEASEDTPARFRSLNSWVAQQSSRVNRGQKRDEASYLASVPQLPCQPGVPGIHNPLVEQTFNLMRDNEKPRPVEEIIIQMRL